MKDILVCALRELTRQQGRAVANIIGYMLAVGIMVVIVNLLLFSKKAESQILSNVGIHYMAFIPDVCDESLIPTEKNEGFLANTILTKILPISLVDDLKKHSDLIQDASPYILFRFKDPTDKHLFTVGGFDPANKQAVNTTCCAKGDIIEGVFIQPGDSSVVLLEQGYAQNHNLSVGSAVKIADASFKVIGIVNPGVRPAKADIYMPFLDAERIITKHTRIPLHNQMNVILVQAASSQKQDDAIALTKKILQQGVVTSYACYQPASKVMGINKETIRILILGLALCVVLLSMKSQYTSVIERRYNIGILKSIGWTDGTIILQIVMECMIQAILGGIMGCIIGAIIILWVPLKDLFHLQTSVVPFISPLVLSQGMLLALIGGIIAGILPAYSAARQKPADMLRQF